MSLTLQEAIIQRHPGYYKCPAHESKSERSRPVRLNVKDGTVLLKDFGGCSTRDILTALGMAWSILFPPRINDPVERHRVQGQREAMEGFSLWRERTLRRVAKALRDRDAARIQLSQYMQDGTISEQTFWDYLGLLVDGYAGLQLDFDVLLRGSGAAALEVYRRQRG